MISSWGSSRLSFWGWRTSSSTPSGGVLKFFNSWQTIIFSIFNVINLYGVLMWSTSQLNLQRLFWSFLQAEFINANFIMQYRRRRFTRRYGRATFFSRPSSRGTSLKPLLRSFIPSILERPSRQKASLLQKQLRHPFTRSLFAVYKESSLPLSTPWIPFTDWRMRERLGWEFKAFKRRRRPIDYSFANRRLTFFTMLLQALRGNTEEGLDQGELDSPWLPQQCALQLPRLFLRVFERRVRRSTRRPSHTPHPHAFLNGPRPKFVRAIPLSRVLSSRVYKSYLKGAIFRNERSINGAPQSRPILWAVKKFSTWHRVSAYLTRRLLKSPSNYPHITLLRYARWRYYRPRRCKFRFTRRNRLRRYKLTFYPRRGRYRLRRRRRLYVRRKGLFLRMFPRTLSLVNRSRSVVPYWSYMRKIIRRVRRTLRHGRRYHRGLHIAKRGIRRYRKWRRRVRRSRRRLRRWRRRQHWVRAITNRTTLLGTRFNVAAVINQRVPETRQQIGPLGGLERWGLWPLRWYQLIDPWSVRILQLKRRLRFRWVSRRLSWGTRFYQRVWYNRPTRKKPRSFYPRWFRRRRLRILDRRRIAVSSFATIKQRLRVRRLVIHASKKHYPKFRMRRQLSRRTLRSRLAMSGFSVPVRYGRGWHLRGLRWKSVRKLYNIRRGTFVKFVRYSFWRKGLRKLKTLRYSSPGNRVLQLQQTSWKRLFLNSSLMVSGGVVMLRSLNGSLTVSRRHPTRWVPSLLRKRLKERVSLSLYLTQRTLTTQGRQNSPTLHQRFRRRLFYQRGRSRRSWPLGQSPSNRLRTQSRILRHYNPRLRLSPLGIFPAIGKWGQVLKRRCSNGLHRRYIRAGWVRRWFKRRQNHYQFRRRRYRRGWSLFNTLQGARRYRSVRAQSKLEVATWAPLSRTLSTFFQWARAIKCSTFPDSFQGLVHRQPLLNTVSLVKNWFINKFVIGLVKSPMTSYNRRWSTTMPIYFKSFSKVPFLLSGCGFLFTQRHSVYGVAQALSSSAYSKLVKFKYSFFYKDDLKRILMRYSRQGSLPQIFTRLQRFLQTAPFPLQFQKVQGVVSSTSGASRVASLFGNPSWKEVRYGERNLRSLVSPLHPFLSHVSTSLRIKRIRFKPGYYRVWRRAREGINYILQTHFRYQHRLTDHLHKYRRVYDRYSSQFLSVTLGRFLVDTRFVLDYRVSLEILQMNLVYLNGRNSTNHLVPLVAGDIVQIVISLKYYITARWLVNWNRKERSRMMKLANFRRNKSQYDLSKQRSYRLPDWIFYTGFKRRDVPKYVEVDYFTLSAFILYEPLCMSSMNPMAFLEGRVPIFSMYNFYYMT